MKVKLIVTPNTTLRCTAHLRLVLAAVRTYNSVSEINFVIYFFSDISIIVFILFVLYRFCVTS